MMDLDPQCNLTIYGVDPEKIADIWLPEDQFIEDYDLSKNSQEINEFEKFVNNPRSIHFILKPTEEGKVKKVTQKFKEMRR